MGLRLSLLLALVSVPLSLACTRSGGDGNRLGQYCYEDRSCASGVCLKSGADGYCTAPCQSDAPCDGDTRCGTLPDGSRSCLRLCSPEVGVQPGYACMDGVPVACETLGQEWCSECGCPAGLRCQKGVGCSPLSEVGEPCDLDSDCRTSNCSTFAHVCRTPLGQPCVATNCDQCVHDPSGVTYCSRQCTSTSQCGSLVCQTGYPITYCRPACAFGSDSLCPGSCRFISTKYECACTSCTYDEPARELGAGCWNDAHCKDGECLTPSLDACVSSQPYGCGTCTKGCTADADCGAGLACATVTCVAGLTTECGNLCLRLCDGNSQCEVGACRTLPGAAGVSIAVCDPRRAQGEICVSNDDCQSGRCVVERCAPAAGVGNGASCTTSADCASGNCISNFCRGAALLGDPCTVSADCAVGACRANVCASP